MFRDGEGLFLKQSYPEHRKQNVLLTQDILKKKTKKNKKNKKNKNKGVLNSKPEKLNTTKSPNNYKV